MLMSIDDIHKIGFDYSVSWNLRENVANFMKLKKMMFDKCICIDLGTLHVLIIIQLNTIYGYNKPARLPG